MGLYGKYVEPALVSFACGQKPFARQREKIVPLAHGTVLEIGFGSGLNLPFYDPARVNKLIALEPSAEMRRRATQRVRQSPLDVEFIDLPGEEIPLDLASVDSILITYTLCTIPAVAKAVEGMRRVLKPGGEVFFSEHGRAPDNAISKWQDRLDGVWGALAGGCHLNRAIPPLLTEQGFAMKHLEETYLPGLPKILAYNYWGTAVAQA